MSFLRALTNSWFFLARACSNFVLPARFKATTAFLLCLFIPFLPRSVGQRHDSSPLFSSTCIQLRQHFFTRTCDLRPVVTDPVFFSPSRYNLLPPFLRTGCSHRSFLGQSRADDKDTATPLASGSLFSGDVNNFAGLSCTCLRLRSSFL